MTKKELGQKTREYFEQKEKGKVAYARADELLGEISGDVETGAEVQMFDDAGKAAGKAQLIDQFAQKKIVWRPCGVRRYELKLIS